MESIDRVKTVIEEFIKKNVSVNTDETISVEVLTTVQSFEFPRCTNALEAAFPADTNRNQINSVDITCRGANAWHVMMPVNVHINMPVIVAKHTIPLKQLISEDDIDYANTDRNKLFLGYYKDKNEVIGQEAAQLISAGTVLNKKNLQSPVLVHRNQSVELIAQHGMIRVVMKGIAKTEGRLNDIIKAYNPSSNQMMDAVVTGSNEAEVVS